MTKKNDIQNKLMERWSVFIMLVFLFSLHAPYENKCGE